MAVMVPAMAMSFQDHAACLLAEHERMEQALKIIMRENSALRERLKSVGGPQSVDTSPSTTSEHGSGQVSVEEPAKQEQQAEPPKPEAKKLTGDWDAHPRAIAVEAGAAMLELPLQHDELHNNSGAQRSINGEPEHISGFSSNKSVTFGGQEIDRFCMSANLSSSNLNLIKESQIPPRRFSFSGRESSVCIIDFGGAPPEVWPEWGVNAAPGEQHSPTDQYCRGSVALKRGQSQLYGEAISDESSCCQRLVVRPQSELRAAWDTASMLVLSYDIISIPLEVFTMTDEDTDFTMGGMEWFTTAFWTLDIVASFLTGFHHEGLVEMRPSKIAIRYIRSGFLLDFVVVLVDWVLAIFTFNIKAVIRVGKTARVFRLLRMVRAMRLIRSFKIARLVTSLFTYIKSDLVRTLCSIVLMLIVLCVANHYIACGWFLMGQLSDANGWLQAHMLGNEINDKDYVYMTSLHWSLTQFTPASMEVHPHNFHERVYTVCVLLFALVTFSSFVSGITSGMMYLRKLKTEPAQQEAILRQYFQESRISAELGQRIWKFLQNNHYQHRKRVHRKDLTILDIVPEYLNNLLSEELYIPVVMWNPFLKHFGNAASGVLNEVCHHAVTEKCLTTREELFHENKAAERMSFITSGTMDYRHRLPSLCSRVGSGLWACEPVLWLTWTHCGTLLARTSCEIVQLDAGKFRSILTRDRFAIDYASSYAKIFRDFLMTNSTVWYTDIWCDLADLEELLSTWEDDQSHTGEDVSQKATTNSEQAGPPSIRMRQTSSVSSTGKAFFQRFRFWRSNKRRHSGNHNYPHHGNQAGGNRH